MQPVILQHRRVLSFDMGTRNLAFALIEFPIVVVRMGVIDLQKNSAREATDSLINTLHAENSWMGDFGHDVVVELQPGSGVCKTLSHVLQAWFHTIDQQRGRTARPFRFMSAGNKLRFDPVSLAAAGGAKSLQYKGRKDLAVLMARKILSNQSNQPRFLAFFDGQSYKRQTDLADAILQGCRHLQD